MSGLTQDMKLASKGATLIAKVAMIATQYTNLTPIGDGLVGLNGFRMQDK